MFNECQYNFSLSPPSISLEGARVLARKGRKEAEKSEREWKEGREKTGIGKGRGWMKNNNQKRREEGERGVRGEKDRKGERGMREERKERGATEKWGARKEGGGESRGEGQKRKGMEGWVKGEQPGIVQSRA
jgi:hypothetical protein